MLAHIAGMPVEELLMPLILSAGGVLAGLRAMLVRRRTQPPTVLDENKG